MRYQFTAQAAADCPHPDSGVLRSLRKKAGKSTGIDDLTIIPEGTAASFNEKTCSAVRFQIKLKSNINILPVTFTFSKEVRVYRNGIVIAWDISPIGRYGPLFS